MCEPISIMTAAAGGLSAIGSHQSASAQANAANSAATSNYKYQLKVRERSWDRERHRYGTQLQQYKNAVNENGLAAQRAYASAQTKLNEKFADAAFRNQGMAVKMLESSGQLAAKGRTGKSAQRAQSASMAAFGRNQATLTESLLSATLGTNETNRSLRRELISSNNQAYSKVAIAPQPGVAPPPPTMTPGPSGLALAGGLLAAGASGFSTYEQLKPPSPNA
jgi:hypothetical protein